MVDCNMNRVYKWYLRMHNSKSKFIQRAIEVYLHIVYSCDIPAEVQIGKNCSFAHNALGVVINPKVIIGDNCHIGQNVTIGGRNGHEIVPILGNNVLVGANALILGPITIGDNSIIGAGAIVVKDVPPNSVVRSEASKIYKRNSN